MEVMEEQAIYFSTSTGDVERPLSTEYLVPVDVRGRVKVMEKRLEMMEKLVFAMAKRLDVVEKKLSPDDDFFDDPVEWKSVRQYSREKGMILTIAQEELYEVTALELASRQGSGFRVVPDGPEKGWKLFLEPLLAEVFARYKCFWSI